MITIEQLITIIISIAPSLVAFIGCIISFLKNKISCQKVVDKLNEVISEKEYAEVKQQLIIVHQENIELKNQINRLIAKLNNIKLDEGE